MSSIRLECMWTPSRSPITFAAFSEQLEEVGARNNMDAVSNNAMVVNCVEF